MSAPTFTDIMSTEVAALQAAHPDPLGEIARSHALIANGHVVPVGDGHAQMLSSTDPNVWYDVNAVCSCPDAHYRKVHFRVKAPVTRRPPHRPGRARLTHPVPR